MPKIPPRDNRRNRSARTIQGTAENMSGLLQRISRRSEVAVSTEGAPGPLSHIEVIRAGLPDGLRAHVTACLLRPGEWVLFADAAVWLRACGWLPARPWLRADSGACLRSLHRPASSCGWLRGSAPAELHVRV